jgi:hypothetical protein
MRDDARAFREWGTNKAQERSATGGRLHMQGPPGYIIMLHALAEETGRRT